MSCAQFDAWVEAEEALDAAGQLDDDEEEFLAWLAEEERLKDVSPLDDPRFVAWLEGMELLQPA